MPGTGLEPVPSHLRDMFRARHRIRCRPAGCRFSGRFESALSLLSVSRGEKLSPVGWGRESYDRREAVDSGECNQAD